MASRWGRASQSEKDEQAAIAREGITRKYLEQATATFERMSITPTPEQVATAADSLRVADLRERMAYARERSVQVAAEKARVRAVEFAVRQAHRYADILRAYEPTIADKVLFRLCVIVAKDELDAPDGFKAHRCVKRLQALVDDAKARSERISKALDATVQSPVDFEELPDADALLGAPWAGKTADEMAGK
jgi:hypothetical protein